MAGIDYSIPGQFKGIQLESPMNQMAQAMQLRNLQESSQMNALKAQEYRRSLESRNKLARIYADPNLKPGSDEQLLRIQQEVPEEYEGAATRALQRETLLSQKEQRAAAAEKHKFDLKQAAKKEERETIDLRLKQFNEQFPAYSIQSEQDVENRIVAMADDEILGPLSTRFGPLKDTIARNKAEYRRNPRNYVARLSGVSADKILAAADARDREAYENYSLNETLAGRTPLDQDTYLKIQRGEQVARPPAPAAVPAAATEAAAAPAAATEAAAAPAAAPAAATEAAAVPGEDKVLPADVTTARRTGVEFLDPTAEQLYTLAAKTKDKDRSAALKAMADKIQAGFQKQIENQLPVFSQIDLKNETVITKRDPATGKTTIVDRFAAGTSPADKERLKNESTRIKQENRRIQLEARRVSLQTKRDALEAQKAARQADPEFQQKMASARATGEATAKDAVKAQAILPSVILRGEEGIRLIDELVGKAPVKDKNGKIIVEGTKPHPGFETAVGATWLPGARFIPGTDAANFQSRFDQIKGSAFLEAFEILKGGGAITNVEGEKGTAAINRMALAQDEAEFIAAARDVQNIMISGIKKAKARLGGGSTSGTNAPAADPLGIRR